MWRLPAWERGQPPPKSIRAERVQLACAASSAHRGAMKRTWRRDRREYLEHRRAELHRARWTPYWGCTSIGGCRWWALPAYIVDCESGGDYTPAVPGGLNFGGAYGLLVETWLQWGGGRFASAANLATPWQQDMIARQVWLDIGPPGWACA